MGPTHNGDAAFRKEAAGVAGIDYPQHLGSDIICDYYSLCGVSLSCAKMPAKRRFLRMCRIDEPRDASCAFHTRANRVELQIVRPSAARDGGWDRGMPRRVRRNSVEKRRTAKNRRKFCICETERVTLPTLLHSRRIRSLASPVSARPPRALPAS